MLGWIALVAIGLAAAPEPQALSLLPRASEVDIREEQAIAAVYRCFWAAVGQPDAGLPALTRSPTYELYFWHQLGEASRELGGLPELGWCKPYFVDPIRRAQGALLHADGHAHAAPHQAPTERAIVAAAHAYGGSARHGLSERVVRAALAAAPAASWGLSADEVLYVVHAAAAVDTLLFFAPSWHAYSAAKAIRPTSEEVALSQSRFVAHVAAIAQLARPPTTAEQTLLGLGLSAGMLVDLHLHRGLSRPEAAALHVRHAPLGLAIHASRVDEAAVTADIVAVWAAALPDQALHRRSLSAHQAARLAAMPEEAIGEMLQAVAPDYEPLNAQHLWRQIRQAAAFRQLGQLSAPPVGAGHWSVNHTVGAIVGCVRGTAPGENCRAR